MSRDNAAISSKRTIRLSREALLQKAVDEPDLSWRVLITVNIFRMLVAAALLGLFFSSGEPCFLFQSTEDMTGDCSVIARAHCRGRKASEYSPWPDPG